MPNIKTKPTKDFTSIRNTMIRDKRLNLVDRGLLITMLSYGKNWNFTIKGLASQMNDKESRIRTALKRLEKAGYLVRTRIRFDGKIVKWDYTFKDEVLTEEEIAAARSIKADFDKYNKSDDEQDIDIPEPSEKEENKNCNDSTEYDPLYERKKYTEIIKENISFDNLADWLSYKEAMDIVNIMVDQVCSQKPTENIGGDKYPREVVKSIFLKADINCVQTAVYNMREIFGIKKPRKYFITTLFNVARTYNFDEGYENRSADYMYEKSH